MYDKDSDDEDVEEEIDAQIEQLLSAKRTVKNIDSASAAAMLGPSGLSTGQDGAPVAQDKLALAKQLASKINIKVVAGGKGQTQFTVATEAFLKGGEGAGQTIIWRPSSTPD